MKQGIEKVSISSSSGLVLLIKVKVLIIDEKLEQKPKESQFHQSQKTTFATWIDTKSIFEISFKIPEKSFSQ
jgi:hypothetical protein